MSSCSPSKDIKIGLHIYEDQTSLIFVNPDCITLFNRSGFQLTFVELKVTVYGENGDRKTKYLNYSQWDANDSKKVYFSEYESVLRIQKVKVRIESDQGYFSEIFYNH